VSRHTYDGSVEDEGLVSPKKRPRLYFSEEEKDEIKDAEYLVKTGRLGVSRAVLLRWTGWRR
jgi:hypothetical protein